jgi:hypothetical protein
MIFNGAQARYPNVRMIFSHGGGTMPFLVERFANMAKGAQYAARFPQGFAGAAAKFFYDTAQVANPAAMSALCRSPRLCSGRIFHFAMPGSTSKDSRSAVSLALTTCDGSAGTTFFPLCPGSRRRGNSEFLVATGIV